MTHAHSSLVVSDEEAICLYMTLMDTVFDWRENRKAYASEEMVLAGRGWKP